MSSSLNSTAGVLESLGGIFPQRSNGRYAGAKVAKVLESKKSGDGPNLLLLPPKNTRRFFLIAFFEKGPTK